MVQERVGSLAWLRKRIEQADADLLREMVKTMAEALISADVDAKYDAPYRRPSSTRVNQRNGYRERRWDTRVGTIDFRSTAAKGGVSPVSTGRR